MGITSNRVWHSGPPPHIGWWNASPFNYDRMWSWWDGKNWSRFCMSDMLDIYAAKQASYVNDGASEIIYWTDYWPENARVERIKPEETCA
jgi:hypothetical protein